MDTLDQILTVNIKDSLTRLKCEANDNVVSLYLEEVNLLCDPDNDYTIMDSINNQYEESILTKCLDIVNDNN